MVRIFNVKIEKFKIKDFSIKYLNWLKDKNVTKFTQIKKINLINIRKYVIQNIKSKKSDFFKIIINNTFHVGNLRVVYSNNQTTLALIIGDKKFWNKGVGTQAIKVALKFIKKKKNKKIFAYIDVQNKSSIKIFEKNNFKKLKNEKEKYIYKY